MGLKDSFVVVVQAPEYWC